MRGLAGWVIPMLVVVLSFVPTGYASDSFETLIALPSADDSWTLGLQRLTRASLREEGSIEIRGVGTFWYDPSSIVTQREDLFEAGHFSAFDVLVALHERGEIALEWEYDELRQTFVVLSINGLDGWWYDVRLPGAMFERTLLRIDTHPVREGSTIYLYLEDPAFIEALASEERAEIARREENEGRLIIPEVRIKGPRSEASFHDVLVTAHNARPDVFRPGVVTLLDVLLSLGEAGGIGELLLAWYTGMENAQAVEHYWVRWIGLSDAPGESMLSCEYMGWASADGLAPFLSGHTHDGSHLHLSPDLVPLVSPGVVIWEWICAEM